MDNIFIERLWRSIKYEEVHLKAYADGREARDGIGSWMNFYNHRPASGDEQPVSHGGMACRHGQDRGGEGCGYAASLGQRKRVAHIPTADAKTAEGSCLILKDKGRRDHTLTPAILGPMSGVHFTRGCLPKMKLILKSNSSPLNASRPMASLKKCLTIGFTTN
jgi:hypothetical protein